MLSIGSSISNSRSYFFLICPSPSFRAFALPCTSTSHISSYSTKNLAMLQEPFCEWEQPEQTPVQTFVSPAIFASCFSYYKALEAPARNCASSLRIFNSKHSVINFCWKPIRECILQFNLYHCFPILLKLDLKRTDFCFFFATAYRI